MPETWVDGIVVFLVGAVVGIGELIARYRDEPRRAITTRPAILYVVINGLASVFALVAIVTFGWTASSTRTSEAQRLVQILAAGFGAMAVFRTSLFVVRVGNTDVGVGPIAFLQILLGATDRGVDRKRASDRATKVVTIMADLEPSLAYNALPAFAIMLMQNLTLEDQKAIGDQVKALIQPESDVPEQAKVLNVGLLLMNFVGEEVLEDAVRGIRGQLKPSSGVHLPALGGRLGGDSTSQGGTSQDLETVGSTAGNAPPVGEPRGDAIAGNASAAPGSNVMVRSEPTGTVLPSLVGSTTLGVAEHPSPATEPTPGASAPGTAVPPRDP
jgi:hypothetical protein